MEYEDVKLAELKAGDLAVITLNHHVLNGVSQREVAIAGTRSFMDIRKLSGRQGEVVAVDAEKGAVRMSYLVDDPVHQELKKILELPILSSEIRGIERKRIV